MSYTTRLHETWTRANTSVGSGADSTTGLGNSWKDRIGDKWNISGNTAITTNGGTWTTDWAYWTGTSSSFLNGQVMSRGSTADGKSSIGVVARADSAADTSYEAMLFYNGGSPLLYLHKRVSGSETELFGAVSLGVSVPASHVVKLSAINTDDTHAQLIVSVYDAADLSTPVGSQSYTDTSPLSAGYWGVTSYGSAKIYETWIEQLDVALAAGTASVSNTFKTAAIVTSGNSTGGSAPLTYQWHRSTSTGFTPGAGTVVSGATSTTLTDTGLQSATTYYYKLVTTDALAATVTSNQLTVTTLAATAHVVGFVGDSITLGTGATGLNAVDTASAALNAGGFVCARVNEGISGKTSGDWVQGQTSYTAAVAAFAAAGVDTICVMLGTNDSKTAVATSAVDYSSNIADLAAGLLADISTLRRVILHHPTAINPGGEWDSTSNDLLAAYGVKLAALDNGSTIRDGDTLAYAQTLADATYLNDAAHPNQKGHTLLGTDWAVAIGVIVPSDESKVMQSAGGNLLTTDVRSDTGTGAAAGGTLNVYAVGDPKMKERFPDAGGFTTVNITDDEGEDFEVDPNKLAERVCATVIPDGCDMNVELIGCLTDGGEQDTLASATADGQGAVKDGTTRSLSYNVLKDGRSFDKFIVRIKPATAGQTGDADVQFVC